jgi:hypothetical protein
MIHTLLWLALSSFSLSLSSVQAVADTMTTGPLSLVSEIPAIYPPVDTDAARAMLQKQAPTMSESVISKVVTALKCATNYSVLHTQILTVIDYSLPSNKKRLWVFDLNQHQLLFHTYVSHGIKSGTLLTNSFSNKYNSKASSIGVYRTEQSYYGREGLSLRLQGLERSFNDNASNRSIVMHGGWYVEEPFIKRYGRPGRSWGCPALPLGLYKPIINTIKDSSLMVVYYPSDEWFVKSKFLTCNKTNLGFNSNQNQQTPLVDSEHRDDVFFAQVNKGGEDKPILVMAADNYERLFHEPAPLGRMLRRQIEHAEYVALSGSEIDQLVSKNDKSVLATLYFVIPTLHMVRGYYETQMKIVNLGAIKEIRSDQSSAFNSVNKNYTVNFNATTSVRLKSTDRFIRWLGL